MDVGSFAIDSDNNLSPRLIWLAGVVAVCRGVLATVFPAIRSLFNL